MSKPIVSFDERAVKDELRELVGKTIEEAINAMLDEEADQLVGAGPYERAACRAGRCERGFATTSGRVTLKMPKLKGMRFATAVVERYKRRETGVEEAIIEMYPAGASTRRIEDVGEILWGAGVSAGTVSNLNDKAFKAVEEWRCRPLACEYPYVYLPEAKPGRLLRERGGHGGGRRERGRLPRGDRLRRGLHRVVGALTRLPVVAQVLRAARRAHVRGRQGGRHGRLDRRGVPRRQTPALHRALLPQRPRQGSEIEEASGGGHAQGDPRDGVSRGGRRQDRGRGRRPGIDAAQGGRQGGARRACRDAGVLRDAARALAAHPHEQRKRAAQQGDQAQDPRGRPLSRRQVRPDACGRPPEVRRRQRMGIAPLPGRVASQRAVVLTAG